MLGCLTSSITAGQDRARLLEPHKVRTRKGPQIMAAVRTFVITGLHLAGYANIAAARRHQARDTSRPLTTYKIA